LGYVWSKLCGGPYGWLGFFWWEYVWACEMNVRGLDCPDVLSWGSDVGFCVSARICWSGFEPGMDQLCFVEIAGVG